MTGDGLRPDDAPPSIYGPDGQPQFFADPAMDRFVGVVLNLAAELWVQTERLDRLTGAIAERGLATADDLAGAAGDDAGQAAAARDFVARLFAPLREGATSP